MPGAGLMLIAYMAFKQPNKLRMAYLIPKDKAAWLEYLVVLAKKKTVVKYLSDKELKKVILRARPSLIRKKYNYVKDPDAPQSMYWNHKQVADWVEEIGYPHLRNAFLMNCINGRKLVEVDASALNKMGLKDFDEIKKLAFEIRELLQINRPNILRAIARKVPLKLYLQQSVRSGRTYDLLTFKKFCELNGFPYEIVVSNKCALIPCACSVLISPVHLHGEHDQFKDQSSSESGGSSTDKSLADAPSVEYLVRHQVIRNRTIDHIIENLMERFWDPKYKRLYGGDADRIMQRILDEGFLELGFSDPENYTKERVEFATGVSEDLVKELLRTVEVLNDMNKLREELAEDEVRPEYYDNMRLAAENFLECALPIAANYLLGCYSLESMFKEQPEFIEFVNKITEEAERKTNERVPLAELFVDHVLSEAKLRVMAHNDFPYVPLEELRTAKSLAASVLDELLLDTSYIAHTLVSAVSTHHWNIDDLSMEGVKKLRMQRRGIKAEDIIEEQTVNRTVDQSPDIPPEKKKSPSHPEIIQQDGKEESESEWVELPGKRAKSNRPATAPSGKGKESKPGNSQLDITQQQQQRLPEGQQDDFNIAHLMVTPSRENKIKPRSELTAVRSRISGGPSDKHLPGHGRASMTSIQSKMSTFSSVITGHHSGHKELRNKIPVRLRLDDKDGRIYDKSDNIIGELKENGKVIMWKGNIVGHVGSDGVIFSPMGGIVGKIREHDETDVRSKISGGPSDRHLPAHGHTSLTSLRSKMSNFSNAIGHQSEARELRSKILPRLRMDDKDGRTRIYDQSDNIIGELKENGRIIMWKGTVIGHVGSNGVIISPTGGVVGKIKGHDDTESLYSHQSHQTRSGYRIGLGPIKEDAYYRQQNRGRPRPSTAAPSFSQHRIRADGHDRRMTTAPASTTATGRPRTAKVGLRKTLSHEDEVAELIANWSSNHSITRSPLGSIVPSVTNIQRPSTAHMFDTQRRDKPSGGNYPSRVSMTSVRMSNFSGVVMSQHSQHSENKELEGKILPRFRLDDKDGRIYDKSNHIIGEIEENGRTIMLKGNIIGHVGSDGVIYSPMGGVVGKIRGHDETEPLHHPQTKNYGRQRPSTASPNFSQHKIRADEHQRRTTAPAFTGHRRATKPGSRITSSHEDEVGRISAGWSSNPSKEIPHHQPQEGRPRASHEIHHPHPHFPHPPPDQGPRASHEIHHPHPHFPHPPPEQGPRASHEIHHPHPHFPHSPPEQGQRASHEIHHPHFPHPPPEQGPRASHEIHHPHPHFPHPPPPEERQRASHPYNHLNQTNKYNALVGGNQERQHLQGVHEVKKHVAPPANAVPQNVHGFADVESPTNSIAGNAPDDAIHQKKLHRREMVERWAHDLEENARAKDVGAGLPEAEAQQRQIRMAADEIVSDVLQMALTHLLLQAEAGQDTINALKALKKIQLKTTSKDHDPTGKSQILWIPNIRGNKSIAGVTHDAIKFAAKDKVMKTLKQGVKALIKSKSANQEASGFY